MKSLERSIRTMIEAGPEELEGLLRHCHRKSFSKNSMLLNSWELCNEVYFVESGLVRAIITDLEGVEHSVHFAFENQYITDYTAFLLKSQSVHSLQALEDTETIVLSREAVNWGYENMREGNKLGRLIAEGYFIYFDTRIRNMYAHSPIERYEMLNSIFPGLQNRVPQHMIASYLGITPVHLSRLKKSRIVGEKKA